MTADVIKNIDLVEYQISEAAKVSGRLRADITLIAVSKGQTLDRIVFYLLGNFFLEKTEFKKLKNIGCLDVKIIKWNYI